VDHGFLLEKLDVYNKAVNFAEQVIKETRSFPKGCSARPFQLLQILLKANKIALAAFGGCGHWQI